MARTKQTRKRSISPKRKSSSKIKPTGYKSSYFLVKKNVRPKAKSKAKALRKITKK